MKYGVIILLLILPIAIWGITLEQAEEIALENNKDLIIAKQNKQGSYANYKSVKGAIYPQVNLSGSYGVAETDLPGTSQTLEEMPLNTVLSLQQILFSADVFNGLRAAKVYTSINDTNLEIIRNEVLFQTRRLYNNAILSKEVVAVQEEALTIAEAHFAQVTNMFEQGLVSEYDKLRAELQASELVPMLQDAENNLELAKKALLNHIGKDVNVDELEGNILLYSITEIQLEEAINQGLNNRLEMQASELNKDILEIQYQNQKKSYLPTFSLNGSVTNFTSTDEFNVTNDSFGNKYEASINFSLPIFTGFTSSNTEKKYRYEWLNSVTSDLKLRDNITLEITNNYLTLSNNLERLKTAEKNKLLATKALEIAKKRYANQLGTSLEVQSAQLSYSQSKLNYIVNSHDLVESYESLLKSMGKDFRI